MTSKDLTVQDISSGIKVEMQADFQTFKTEINADFTRFKAEIKADFQKFKIEIKEELGKMKTTLLIQLSSVIVLCVGIAFIAFAYINDYRLDFTNEENQEKFVELRNAVFTPSNEAIIREIRELKVQLASGHIKPERKKKLLSNRKINNVESRLPASTISVDQ